MSRREFLAKLEDAYDAWADENADVEVDVETRPQSKDINVWNVEMGASPEQIQQLVDAVGDPSAEPEE